jgi:hypothetical protein
MDLELPTDDRLRAIVAHFAAMLDDHADVLGTPDLIEPTARFFPDPFEAEPESIARLLRRTMSYAPLREDLPVALSFREPAEDAAGANGKAGGCSSGACGTKGAFEPARAGVFARDEGYIVEVPTSVVGHGVLLTSTLARSVGSLVLHEAGDDGASDPGRAELTASCIGFGVLLTSGACVYTKACGGLKRHEATALPLSEHAVALALFLRVHGQSTFRARSHLETTQREAFDEALRWVDSNKKLVDRLRTSPSELRDGVFRIEPVRGFLSRLFSGSRADSAPPPEEILAARKVRTRSAEEERRLAEARALVEEALSD